MVGRELLHGVHLNDYQSQSFLVESALGPGLELKLWRLVWVYTTITLLLRTMTHPSNF